MFFESLSLGSWILLFFLGGGTVYLAIAAALRGPEDQAFTALVRPLCTLYARAFHGLRIASTVRDPVPRQGPALLVANHRSGVEPLLLALVTRRRVRFMMAREYYETKGLRWAFRALGCIPVNRDGNDLGATKTAIKALRDGEVIGIFPQGGIREAGASIEGKAGTALLACRTGAPVVPCYIDGSPNLDSVLLSFITPSRTTISCGDPIRRDSNGDPKPSREELDEMTSRILDAVASLGPKSIRAPEVPSTPPTDAL